MLFRKPVFELGKWDRFCLVLILIAGFGIRLYQIGRDSLWNDEVGVVLAALAPSFQDTIKIARSHVMAMPLDYLIIRLITKVSLLESILRLPSAIFGVLTLAICYKLFQLAVEKRVALLATLMLSLSPLHVMYSQEARFYSSFLFFYYLSTILLLIAIADSERTMKWVFFGLACTTGAYFHFFVLFSVINGFVWALFCLGRGRLKIVLPRFLGSTFVAFLAVLPGYLYFGLHQKFNYPLLLWGKSFLREVALGLGWYELPFVSQPNIGLAWYLICLGLFLVGLIAAIRQFSTRLIALLVSGVVQIFLVISADLAKGYWFVYRQLLFLHPVTLLLSSFGFCVTLNAIRRVKNLEKIPVFALIGLLILAALFSLCDYFQWPKSEARQISEYVVTNWRSANDVILVAPGYQEKVYRFYLQYIFQRPDIVTRIKPIELERLLESILEERTFLIVIENLSEQRISQLLRVGFSPVRISNVWLGHSLFVQTGE